MPTARDSERTRVALVAGGLSAIVCADMDALCRGIEHGAGLALLTEEAFAADAGRLATTLRAQPPWSDFPLVLITRQSTTAPRSNFRETLNVLLVERPLRIRSLLSVVRAALRARRHQYSVRDHLAAREHHAVLLRENEERLQFALMAGRLGSWEIDLTTMQLTCSSRCKQNYGFAPDSLFTYGTLFSVMHPDDQDRVRAAIGIAISERSDYDEEYRVWWPDKTLHWVLARGRATYADDGHPVSMRGVTLDVTERRRNEEALRNADRKKDDFLAVLAHELRNPLAPIRTGLQVLRQSVDPSARQRVQDMMDRQLSHLIRLIDDLLDISRINRDKMNLHLARISIADVIGSALETTRPVVELAGHTLDVDLGAEPILVNADLTRLAQVIANLLTNSAKYTLPGGRIRVVARREGAMAVVAVSDTGIGIPSEALDGIFEMFSQVDRSLERVTGGLGIGLALVRRLVELHGGTVSVRSGGTDRGSEFSVRIPIAAPIEPTAAADGALSLAANSNGHRWRILVVDDSRDAAEALTEMLSMIGNDVAMAHDGVEAVERAEQLRPDVVLMDVAMPRLNGLDATRRIREQPWGRDMRIVALTGWGQDSDRASTVAAGCDGHLVKPVGFDEVVRLLGSLRR